jgi:hypothetical protein
MGVEFLFIGGHRLGELGKAIESHRNYASDRLLAEIQLDQRSGGYSFRASVPI